MRKRPWLLLFLSTPCAIAIWVFAYRECLRVHHLGHSPIHLTTAEALRRARSEQLWVVLSDASFDCERSVMVGEYRYGLARAPGIPNDTRLIVPTYTGLCLARGAPLEGSIERIEEGRLQRGLAERGLRATSLWELSIVRRPSDAWAGAGLLIFLGACVQVLGFFPYLKRRATRRLSVPRPPPLTREALLRKLAQNPLRLRKGYVAGNFALPVVLIACSLAFGVVAVNVAVDDVLDIRAERARWANAEDTPTFGPAAVDTEYRVLATPLLANVRVSWRGAGQSQRTTQVRYSVIWASSVSSPYVVKHDARGTLTSVGLELAPERYGANLFLFVMGLVALVAPWFAVVKLTRRWRDFSAVTRAARPLFVHFQGREVLTHQGMPTGGTAYRFLAPSGESRKHVLIKPREAVFDESGSKILVVTAHYFPNAEPILVADDGYPFA